MAIRKRGEVQGQLAMFMTPRQIQAGYQALDADREGSSQSRWTTRTEGQGTRGYGPTTGGEGYYNRMRAGTRSVRVETTGYETDEQLYDRKYDEATMTPMERYHEGIGPEPSQKYINPAGDTTGRSGEYVQRQTWKSATSHGSSGFRTQASWQEYEPHPEGGSSLRDYLLSGKDFPGHIHLGEEIGSEGKPQIVGGHHRLAVMAMHHPDRYLPVLHHVNIHTARAGPEGKALRQAGYQYT